MVIPPVNMHWPDPVAGPAFHREDKDVFCFEALSNVNCTSEIKIGGLRNWFTQCLELRIQNKGGPLKKARWKIANTKRWHGHGTFRSSSKKWWYPEYDWKEFAERNNITIPGHYEWLKDIK